MNLFHRRISDRIFVRWARMGILVFAALAIYIRFSEWYGIYLYWFLMPVGRDLPGRWVRGHMDRQTLKQVSKTAPRPWLVWAKRLALAGFWFALFYAVVMWTHNPTLIELDGFIQKHSPTLWIAGTGTALLSAMIAREFLYFRNVPEADVFQFLKTSGTKDLPLRDRYEGVEVDPVPEFLAEIQAERELAKKPRILTPGKVYTSDPTVVE